MGQEVRGQRVQRGPGQWACGYGVRWVCRPRAECQAERHLGGLTLGPMGERGMEWSAEAQRVRVGMHTGRIPKANGASK